MREAALRGVGPPHEAPGLQLVARQAAGRHRRDLDPDAEVHSHRLLDSPRHPRLAARDRDKNGGGPTPDKSTVTLSVPDPNHINSFMNFRVADIQACYELWKSRGAEFITEPIPKYGETRCYIRDPDGYIIEVGQSNPGVAYG